MPNIDEFEMPSEDLGGKILAVDFDGTIVERAEFPAIGEPFPDAIKTLRRLMHEGWKIIVHSHRAVTEEGREQIRTWLDEHDLGFAEIAPKIFARYYIDDRGIGFSGSWDDVCAKVCRKPKLLEHKPDVTSGAVLAGRFGMKEIANELGISADELRSDIYSATLATTPEEKLVCSNVFKNKYGMSIDYAKMASAKFSDDYWRSVMASALAHNESSSFQPGDDVILLVPGAHFGKAANVMSADGESLSVAVDGVANDVVTASLSQVRHMRGHERKAMLSAYGSSKYAAHYKSAGKQIYAYANGTPLITLHNVAGTTEVCHCNNSGSFDNDVNSSNLEAVYIPVSDAHKTAAVMVSGSGDYRADLVKEAAAQIAEYLSNGPVRASAVHAVVADNRFYLLASYKDSKNSAAAMSMAAVKSFTEDSGYGSAITSGKLVVSCGLSSIPAAYSINPATGSQYTPVSNIWEYRS